MRSDALDQFRDEFGCWVTDHGLTFMSSLDDDEGSRVAEVDLPALEAAIGELITAAAEQAAGVGHVHSWAVLGAQPHTPFVMLGKPVPHTITFVRCQGCGEPDTRMLAGTWTLDDLAARPACDQVLAFGGGVNARVRVLSCGCEVVLPVRMAPGREVLCDEHGPAAVRRPARDDDSFMDPAL